MEDGALIETYSKDDLESAENQNGSSGGQIKIVADNAFGVFKAEMRGRNAGIQTNNLAGETRFGSDGGVGGKDGDRK